MPLNLDDNRIAMAIPPVLRLAFRPFFLAGALFSAIAMAIWIWVWSASVNWQPYGGAMWWHGHEMVFGFACLIVVGFLLTAVKNWTGVTGFRGWPLFCLFVLWLIGRLALGLSFLFPQWDKSFIFAFLDLLFLPFAAFVMFIPVYKVRQWHNMFFVPILILFSVLNAISHWAVINEDAELANRMLHSSILMICLVITIIAGRVMPMFTANGTGSKKVFPIKWLDQASLLSLILIILCSFIGFSSMPKTAMAIVFCIASLLNGYRFFRWGFWRCWNVPLLWSLHLAYAFIPVGLLAMAIYFSSLLSSFSTALHFFSAGAIGGMILSMTSRVSLGHSGRPLQPPRIMNLAFFFIILAALIRIFVPIVAPLFYQVGIVVAGSFWVVAFAIFCFCYGPMLLTTRVDGRPG